MAEIVNLRTARKRRARAEKADAAAENRARHGVSKAERNGREIETLAARRSLDAHRREPPDEGR